MLHERTILGLDLGIASIGWAFLKLQKDGYFIRSGEILGTNSRIFPAAVEGRGKDQKPKNAGRREARHQRRQHRRKRQRRNKLRVLLMERGLLPHITSAESSKLFNDAGREEDSNAGSNPYKLRARALIEKLSLHQIGVAVFHLAKRRGFESSRLHGKPKEDGPVIKEIGDVHAKMKEARLTTPGAYLSTLKKKRGSDLRERRGYMARGDFKREFEEIWSVQGKFHPDILTEPFRQQVWDIIFTQGDARWDRNLIGKCTFNDKKKRCFFAHQDAQRFRYWQDINNLRIQNMHTFERPKLTLDQKQKLAKLLENTKEIKVETIPKKLGIQGSFRVNLSQSKKTLYGNKTAATFRTALGKSEWNNLTEDERDKLINVIYRIGEDDQILHKHLSEKWNFSNEQIEKILKINLEENFSRHSHYAISRMLPFMKQGYLYNEAFSLAKYKDAVGRAKWGEFDILEADIREKLFRDLIDFRGKETDVVHLKIRWGLHDEIIGKLEREYAKLKSQFATLGHEKLEPLNETLRNPIVQKALTQVRKVVNEIIRKYGKPDEIRVELGRELKMTFDQKSAYEKQTRENKRLNDDAVKELGPLNGGQKVKGKLKLKYRLWRELKDSKCPYSDEYISRKMLLQDGLIEIDHIIPFKRCWDDSYMNKTVCFGHVNREKRNTTPREHFGGDEDKYYSILQGVKEFPEAKRKRFEMTTEEVANMDWAGRQLSDTRYISKKAREYLLQLYDNEQAVTVVTGQSTELLRRNWGLNKILNPEGKDEKYRRDHRHHAIDAIVVALTNRRLFDQISTLAGKNREEMHSTFHNFPKPWKNFYENVEQAILSIDKIDPNAPLNSVVVSHTPTRQVRGEYFKQGAYSKVNGKFAHRVPLKTITNKNWKKIVDDGIKAIVKERLDEFDDNSVKAFAEPLYIDHTNPKKKSYGEKTQIRRVRVYEDKFVERKAHIEYGPKDKHTYYASGGNHHAELIENIRTGKRRIYVVSLHEAYKNIRHCIENGERPSPNTWPLKDEEKPLFTLYANDYVEYRGTNDELGVYRVQKVSQGEKGFEIMLRKSHDGFTEAKEGKPERIQGVTSLPNINRKLQVDPLGRLTTASD